MEGPVGLVQNVRDVCTRLDAVTEVVGVAYLTSGEARFVSSGSRLVVIETEVLGFITSSFIAAF